jgi:hypothetical protein
MPPSIYLNLSGIGFRSRVSYEKIAPKKHAHPAILRTTERMMLLAAVSCSQTTTGYELDVPGCLSLPPPPPAPVSQLFIGKPKLYMAHLHK